MFQYTLIRSRRKTVAVYITKDAAVEVRAPLRMPGTEIDRFIESKGEWIAFHLARRQRLNREKAAFVLSYGDMATFCGKEYPIRAKDGSLCGFDGECFYLPAGLKPEDIKHAVVQIYKTAAKRMLVNKVNEFAKLMNVKPAAVKITSAKTRWGSCSGKNSISFSWRLIMAEESVIDYVVVHELAHIREHNHSPRFWAVVEKILPDYQQRRNGLVSLQDKLSREDWS